MLDGDILTFRVAEDSQLLTKDFVREPRNWVVPRACGEPADASGSSRLLTPDVGRPNRRGAKERDDLPPPCMSGKEHSEG